MLYVVSSGGGQFPNVQITTTPNATVTLSKGDVILTKTADSDGNALFESVEYGSWTATVTLDETTVTDTIEVQETIQKEMPLGLSLSSLPLKTTKLKIGGIKWILFTRNHEGYPSGAQTLVSEYLLQLSAFGSSNNYANSTVKQLCEDKYQALSENEKAFVVETTRKIENITGQYNSFAEHMFILTSVETGLEEDSQMVSNIGFESNNDRIKYIEGTASTAYRWWLANAFFGGNVSSVNTDGTLIGTSASTSTVGVLAAMNLSQNTLLNETPDEEGYYTIYRKVETANDLLIGDKIKIGGTKYIVKAKGHEGYPQNAVTLISEYLLQGSLFGTTSNYSTSTIKSLCETYYNELSQAEKDAILLTTRKVRRFNSTYPEFSEHIFILNSAEVGLIADTNQGTNIGFADNASRIAYSEDGSIKLWWLADAHSSSRSAVCAVTYVGAYVSVPVNDTSGVRPALNLLPEAPIAPMDNTGYYSIQGADDETTLMAKALNILGVQKE